MGAVEGAKHSIFFKNENVARNTDPQHTFYFIRGSFGHVRVVAFFSLLLFDISHPYIDLLHQNDIPNT